MESFLHPPKAPQLKLPFGGVNKKTYFVDKKGIKFFKSTVLCDCDAQYIIKVAATVLKWIIFSLDFLCVYNSF